MLDSLAGSEGPRAPPETSLPIIDVEGPVCKRLRPAHRVLAENNGCLLGVIGYGSLPEGGATGRLPTARIDLPVLGPKPLAEAWYGRHPAEYGEAEGIRYAQNGEVLFGIIELSANTIDSAACESYLRIIRLALSSGYPNLVRLWNYFPGINDEYLGLERYKRFCLGRYQAFSEAGYRFGEDLPAASTIGTEAGDLRVYFLASRSTARQIENPRQVSAYRYPLRYGPRSPSFSRAMQLGDEANAELLISGTASIVGHETVHAGNVLKQCAETVENLRAILAQAGGTNQHHGAIQGRRSAWKIYLRHAADYERVRDLAAEALGSPSSLLFLRSHICRQNLLLEIEGVVSLRDTLGES